MEKIPSHDTSSAGLRVQNADKLEGLHLHHHRLVEVDLENLESQLVRAQEQENARHVTHQDCKSCGAQIEIPKELALGECLFCGRKVTSGKPEASRQPPDQGLIPFQVSEEQAVEAMKEHVALLWLRPGGIVGRISLQTVRKVYVPFWAFDTRVETTWGGNYELWKEAGWWGKLFGKDGSYKKFPIQGESGQEYDDWLVCASHGVESDVIRQIEPFHTEGLLQAVDRQEFSETPLESISLKPRQAWEKAQVEIRKSEYKKAHKDALVRSGAEEARIRISGKVRCSKPVGKSVVLPLFIFHGPGRARVVVNGENGKAGSSIPYSWYKTVPLTFLILVLAVFLCVVSGGLLLPVAIVYGIYSWWKTRRKHRRDEASFLSG